MLLHFLLVDCTIRILNTKINEGTLHFQYNVNPYIVICEYPEGVVFKGGSKPLPEKLNFQRNVYRRIFKVNNTVYLKYRKSLCKEFDYDKIFEEGILFKFWIIKGGLLQYIELKDWMPRPDLSMIFIGTISTGLLLSAILKALRH